jgi:hypothetical protein
VPAVKGGTPSPGRGACSAAALGGFFNSTHRAKSNLSASPWPRNKDGFKRRSGHCRILNCTTTQTPECWTKGNHIPKLRK